MDTAPRPFVANTGAQPLAAATYVTASDDGPSSETEEKVIKDVTNLGLGVLILITVVIIFFVWAGLRVIEQLITGTINAIDPLTACGKLITSKEQDYRSRGFPRCDAYIRAINEAAVDPNSLCITPSTMPPASSAIYAEFLREQGCTPPPSGS